MSREYWDQWLTRRREIVRLDMLFLKELLQRGISTLLDVGSGRGGGVKELAVLGFRITCVDSSLQSIHYLRQVSQDDEIKYMNVVCADLLSLPFHDDSFGACSSMNVMNFFTDEAERERAFAEMFRVLTPGGVALFVVISDRDEGAKNGIPLGGGNFQLSDGMCLHYYTASELERILERMNILQLDHFEKVDTTHDVPHIHRGIRVLASCE